MSKAVKAVVGLATLVVGVVTANPHLIRIGGTLLLSAATESLASRDESGITSFTGLQTTSRSALEYHKIVYGEALVSGPIFYSNVRNPSNQDLHYGVAFTGHEIDSYVGFYIDNVYVPLADIGGGGAVSTAEFVGTGGENAVYMQLRQGTDTQAADSFLSAFSDWGAAHQLKGRAYASYIFRYVEATAEVWEKGVPQRLAALVKGKKVYDPRLDSTNGGSGTHRYTDSTTWEWSDNPSLCIADYLVDYMGSDPADDIDWPAVIAAADDCDVLVNIPDGLGGSTTEKRFTCNGATSTGTTHARNLQSLLSSMDGRLSWSGGKWKLRASVWEASTFSLDESDLKAHESVRGSSPASERYNIVKGHYVDPVRDYQPVEFQPAQAAEFLTRDNGVELPFDVELPFTNSEYMAQRIAYRRLEQFDNQIVATVPLNLVGANITTGAVVDLTLSHLSWAAKTFRVINWKPVEDGGFEVTLQEDFATRYTDPEFGDYSTKDDSGVITPPTQTVPAPSGLAAVNVDGGIQLDWTNPAGRLFEFIDIYASPDDQWANAVKVGEVRTDNFLYANAVGRQYFWIRARSFDARESDRFPDSDTSTITAVGNLTYVTGSITNDPFMYSVNGAGAGNWITTGNNSVSHQLTEGLNGSPAKRFPSSSTLSGDAILNQLFDDATDDLIQCPDGTVLEYEIRMKSSVAGLPIRVGFDVYDSTDAKIEDDNEGEQAGIFSNTVADTYQSFIGRFVIDANALGGTGPYHLATALRREYVGDDETIDVDMFRNVRLVEFGGALKSGVVPPVDGVALPTDGKVLGDAGWSFPEKGDVRNYGAKVDGSTDDTAALTSAIAGEDGGIVYIPNGELITGPQDLSVLTNGVTIVGAGVEQSKITLKETAGSTHIFGSNDDALSNIEIRDLTLDLNWAVHGTGGTAVNTNVTGIRIGDSTASGGTSNDIIIENVQIKDATQHGIIASRFTNAKITNCHVDGFGNFGIALFRGCIDCIISNNRVDDSQQEGVICIQVDDRSTASTTPEPCKGIVITGNTVDGNTNASVGINQTGSRGVTITANTVRLCNNGIISQENETDSTTLVDGIETVISSNVIDECQTTGNDNGGILLAGGYNVVNSNIIKNGVGNGLVIKQGHSANTVEGNVITGNQFILNATTSDNEIYVQGGTNNIISGNYIEATRIGVRVLSDDAVIEGLELRNNIIKAGSSFAVEVRNDSNDVTDINIDGNSITNVASGSAAIRINDIGANALSDIYIRNNRIRDEAAASTGISIVDAGIVNTRVEFNVVDCTTPYSTSATDDDVVYRTGNSFDPRITYGTAAPTGGTWGRGDIVYDTTPSASGTVGWICTTAGTPGTWKTFGTIAA